MDIPADLLPGLSLWLAALVYAVLLMAALLTAPWPKLLDKDASNIYFGAVAMVSVLWILRAGIEPGFNYHLLGVTALCLMFDWQFAVLAVSDPAGAGKCTSHRKSRWKLSASHTLADVWRGLSQRDGDDIADCLQATLGGNIP